jgi:hypothetical protein
MYCSVRVVTTPSVEVHPGNPGSARPKCSNRGDLGEIETKEGCYMPTDPSTVVDGLLADGIPALQNNMASMSLGCSGGDHGRPPENWGALQVHGFSAVNSFSAARTALATSQPQVAVQQITAGLTDLDALVNGLHLNCSGGEHGEDPVSYGSYVAFRDNLKTQLQTAIKFL